LGGRNLDALIYNFYHGVRLIAATPEELLAYCATDMTGTGK
jgi:hypothetical protein